MCLAVLLAENNTENEFSIIGNRKCFLKLEDSLQLEITFLRFSDKATLLESEIP